MRFLNENDKAIPAPEYQKHIGFIFRAEDLDNYFMIEVGEHDGCAGIKPHVRYKGGWEGMSIEKKDLNFSEFTKVTLKVKGDTAIISVNGTHTFAWVLPIYVDVNHWESGVREEMEKKKNVVVETFSGHVQKITFRLGYGLVGFRAYMKHGAIIKDLRIEPLVS